VSTELLNPAEQIHLSHAARAPALRSGFSLPTQDLGELFARLGCKLFTHDHTLTQYLAWSSKAGLFELMARDGWVAIADVCAHTPLNEPGADSLLCILTALGLVMRNKAGLYALTAGGHEYFVLSSPFYIGDQFALREKRMPRAYLQGRDGLGLRLRLRCLSHLPRFRFGTKVRLRNQHARNLASCAAAVRTGEFAGLRSIVDIAGGSGTFSIPLALELATERIILTELPQALENIRPILREHGLDKRVQLLGMDVFQYPWLIPECDGIFIGNFLHGFGDETCVRICQEAFRHLQARGKLWIHEMIWNANKDGPLITALLHAAMRSGGTGRQRSSEELSAILCRAGFVKPYVVPTTGAFALVAAERP
jgi:3-hydroxy-5-methyl-1-naphthoate 3-O-methyltransferase